jgi:hypothetical protein
MAAAVFVLALLVYNANLRYIGSYDSYATSLLPFRILAGYGLTLADPSAIPEGLRYSIVRAYDLAVPEDVWARRRSTPVRVVLASRSTWRPADVLPGSDDGRELSVEVFRITFVKE